MADIRRTDADILGDKSEINHEEIEHFAELTEQERAIEKKLVRKIDIRIMPLVILVYLMNYIDRNNYAAARLQGLEKDLGLHGSQYQTALSILFVGYVVAQVPSNLLLNHLGRPSLYIGFWVIAWGLVSACTSQVKNYTGILVCRLLLGLVESPFFAGVLYYLSKWYTKKELSLRMSIFYSGSLLSGAFGNLIAAGILSGLAGKRGLSAWQWLYIIEGSITVSIGLIICVVLPDFPHNWSALTPEMKHVANRRMAVEAAEVDVDEPGLKTQLKGLRLAFADPKTYMLAIAYMAITGAAGFQNYFPTLTATLGYNKIDSLLLVAPPYIFMVIYSLIHSIFSDRIGNRFWFFVYPIPITIIGFVVFMTTKGFGPRYFSTFLFIFVFAMNGTCYAWIGNAIPRPPAKRAVSYAFINAVGNSASIWTPFLYPSSDGPDYVVAMGVNIGLQVLALVMALALRFYLQRQNKQLDKLADDDARLTDQDLQRLEKTAEVEGVDIRAARKMQKGYRYMI